MSFKGRIIQIVNDRRVKLMFQVTNEIFQSFESYAENKSKASFALGLGSVMLKVIEHYEVCPWSYFESSWTPLVKREFTNLILKELVKFPYDDLTIDDHDSTIRIHDVKGSQVGYYISNAKKRKVDNIWVKNEDYEEILNFFRELLWTNYGTKSVVMRRSKALGFMSEDEIEVDVDNLITARTSKKAVDRIAYFKAAIEKNVNRSLLIYGPPGTGKSTMAKTIIDGLNLRSFRIKLSDVADINSSLLLDAINIFKPDAIIFDDLDRSSNQYELLETLEMLEKNLKLIIATANCIEKFDAVLLRPGRFDEIELVENLDDEVINSILGPSNSEIFDRVKKWPVAFIEEYKQRCKFITPEQAEASLDELDARAEKILEYGLEDS